MRFFGCAGESGGGITVSRRYDSLGRVIEEKETDGTDTSVNNYSYDVSGNRTEHKLTLSGEVRSWKSYTYDLLGRMKTVGERPILTEKYDYSYKIMIFTMGGYEEYARYSLSYVGDCGEYCCEFDTMAAFYWHDHENSAWYEISLNPEEPLCGEMYISSSGKMAGSIGYQDGSMICRAEEISDLSEIDPDAGTNIMSSTGQTTSVIPSLRRTIVIIFTPAVTADFPSRPISPAEKRRLLRNIHMTQEATS